MRIQETREAPNRVRVEVMGMRASRHYALVQFYAVVMVLALLGIAIWATASLPIYP